MNFLVVNRGSRRLVSSADVDYLISCEKYVQIVCGDKSHLIGGTLINFEPNLPEFLRVHRNCLVKKSLIRGIIRNKEAVGGYNVLMSDGTELHIARRLEPAIRLFIESQAIP